ncbi:MAG: prolipoprotein diacylglyceryl transferase [Deltaproteobacteria bacterium]|nr:MAG: prolipoprotein diacylglyceryl transferase [Deltaproteobacteria bacterium]
MLPRRHPLAVWDLDPILLKLGPLQVRYYGICFAIALFGGFYFMRKQIIRGGRDGETAEKFLLPAVIAVIVGARVGHVLFYEFDRFLADPLYMVYFWRGGLASHGATVGLLITLWWYSRKIKMPLLEVADRFSFSVAWAAAWVRIGNLTNSEIVGRITAAKWGVKFPRYDIGLAIDQVPFRHPSQLYEAAGAFGLLVILFAADKLMGGEKRPTGALAAICLIGYFSGRFMVEYVKEYQALAASSPLTMGQILSLPFILIGVFVLIFSFIGRKRG